MARRGGWRRLGRTPRFRYEDVRGRRIEDEAQLDRIAGLAIPPAWRDVWISPNPGARLQATGVDGAGRRQYIYSAAHVEARDREKFERLVRFGELLPGLRSRMTEHVDRGPYVHEWACAVAVTLINRAWFRVGSERYARSARTYGVTTLRKRHVSVSGRRVRFAFHGKNRSRVRTTIVDDELATAVRALLELPGGSRLFRYENTTGVAPLSAPALNAYLEENLGPGFTAKDFRTWGGTLTAACALAEHGPPASASEGRRVVATVMRRVADELGNTAAVARRSYVAPAVVELYLQGRTLEHFPGRGSQVVSARLDGLRPEEASLLRLLRSWQNA